MSVVVEPMSISTPGRPFVKRQANAASARQLLAAANCGWSRRNVRRGKPAASEIDRYLAASGHASHGPEYVGYPVGLGTKTVAQFAGHRDGKSICVRRAVK